MNDYARRAARYDTEYDFTGDRQLIASLVLPETKTILEIPSGSGRNIWLTETGRTVVFVDREPEMVKILSGKLSARGVRPPSRAVCADLQTLDLGQRFDLIIVPHDAFLLLIEDKDICLGLSKLRHHLQVDGRLLIDVALLRNIGDNVYNLLRCYDPHITDGVWVNDLDLSLENGEQLLRKHRQYHNERSLRFDFAYRVFRNGVEIEAYEAETQLRCYTDEDLRNYLTSAGFCIAACYGDYHCTPYPNDGQRAIYILEHGG